MRSRRNMYLFLVAALALLVASFLVRPVALDLLLTALAAAFGVLFVLSMVARRQDPNGPPGQH